MINHLFFLLAKLKEPISKHYVLVSFSILYKQSCNNQMQSNVRSS